MHNDITNWCILKHWKIMSCYFKAEKLTNIYIESLWLTPFRNVSFVGYLRALSQLFLELFVNFT